MEKNREETSLKFGFRPKKCVNEKNCTTEKGERREKRDLCLSEHRKEKGKIQITVDGSLS